jgi:hypothetical protein
MYRIKNYIKFIKQFPIGLIAGTIVNILCLVSDGYNKVFDNNIFNFLLCEIGILVIYLALYIRSNK